MNPLKVYLFCGKRKCGKDYITDKLYERLNKNDAVIIKISAPIKSYWATQKGLDYESLLGSGNYKELYRKEMISWSEKVRKEDYGIFCRASIEMFNALEKPLWIVSDIRRKTDIIWFREKYGVAVTTVKIVSDNQSRVSRGWTFEEGIDDQETECDLDDVTDWDKIIVNNNNTDIDQIIEEMKCDMESCLAN